MLGLLSFLPSTAVFPHGIFLLTGLYAFYLQFKKRRLSNSLKIALTITIGIIVLSSMNSLFHFLFMQDSISTVSKSITQLLPYSLFIIFSLVIAENLTKKDLKVVMFFISLEVIFGIIEFSLGKASILPWVQIHGESEFGREGLLYYSRVYGLSTNSSVFSYKILIGLILLNVVDLSKKKYGIIATILIIGLVITFNRTAIAVFIGYIVLYKIYPILSEIFIRGKIKVTFLVFSFIILALFLLLLSNFELIFNQFNRGMDASDTSGRLDLWSKYLSFIGDNLLFGNGSFKMWMLHNGKVFHGHNVFLQTLATNGIIIMLLYILLLIFNLNRKVIIYLLPILITGLTQYTYFWGISFVDIFLYFFILKANEFNTQLKWI